VDLAAAGVAFRAREPGAPLEVDAQIKPAPIGIEEGLHHPPRLAEPQRRLEQLDVSHRATVGHAKDEHPLETARDPVS